MMRSNKVDKKVGCQEKQRHTQQEAGGEPIVTAWDSDILPIETYVPCKLASHIVEPDIELEEH